MFVFSPPSKLHAICVGLLCLFFNFQVLGQCDNYIGELKNDTSIVKTLFLCYDHSTSLQVDSVVLMNNQQLLYVFHTQKNLSKVDSILTYNATGQYKNNEQSPKEIFATAVIVEENDSIPINFDDPCLAVSNTISIVNLNPIKIETEAYCKGTKGFSFSISGGLPEFAVDSFYIVTGSYFSTEFMANETIRLETSESNFVPGYTINTFDDAGCRSTYSTPPTDCTHLPVHLISFEGQQTEAGNLLTWIYYNNSNDDFFKIEVSNNFTDWLLIDTIKIRGLSSTPRKYEFLDEKLCDEICYYRLSIIDLDSTAFIEGIVEIYIPINHLEIYPTLSNNFLNVTYESISEIPFHLIIYDVIGRRVFYHTEENVMNFNFKKIDISNLPNNMYFLTISSEDFRATKKLVVQR